MEPPASAEGCEGPPSVCKMMHADSHALAAPVDSNSLDNGLARTAIDVAMKVNINHKKRPLLGQPDVDGTQVGRVHRGEHDVDKRIVASDGRVYFRLKDKSGWVCTTSRRDEDSSFVIVGPVAVCGKTLVTLLK